MIPSILQSDSEDSQGNQQPLITAIEPDELSFRIECTEATRKNFKRPDTPEERYEQTMQGFLCCYLQANGPCPDEKLYEVISQNIWRLRKTDGNRYKGNIKKVFNGIINSSEVFIKTEEGWNINQEQVAQVRENSIESIVKRMKKYNKRVKPLEQNAPQINRKRLECIVKMLKKHLRTMQQDKQLNKLINDPFPGFNGQEDLHEAICLIGHERLMGMIQGYSLLKLYFEMKETKEEILQESAKNVSSNVYDLILQLDQRVHKIESKVKKREEQQSS